MANAVFKLSDHQEADVQHARYVYVAKRDVTAAASTVDDWVVFYRPTGRPAKGKGGCYVGMAFVERILAASGPLPARAVVSNYTPFENPVPAFSGDGVYESSLVGRNWRSIVQRSVRSLPEGEFIAILEASTDNSSAGEGWIEGFAEPQAEFIRDRHESLVSKLARDRRLRAKTLTTYLSRCCISGFSFRDDAGNLEADVSHWQPVSAGGPDELGNVSLVCKTFHWMIDHGQITLADDYRIIAKSRYRPFIRLVNPSGYARMPKDRRNRPSPQFLRYHRQHVFGRS